MNFNWKKIVDEFRILAILILVAFTIKSTLIEIYVVPTGSMEDTILTGDMLIGNKFIYGMRTPIWIGIPYTRIGFNIPWFRLPGFKEVQNGDVTIFEFPRDPFQKYVKRCIGIPGDTISLKLGEITINDNIMKFPKDGKYIIGIDKTDKVDKLYSFFSGNKDNISTFIVPFKGMEIDMNNINDWMSFINLLVQDGNDVRIAEKKFSIIDPQEIARTHGFLKYKILRLLNSPRQASIRENRDRTRFIQELSKEYRDNNIINPWHINYGSTNIEYIKNNLTINHTKLKDLKKYVVKRDYYFFMGDNRDSSYDSRYWGFVPDNNILGTPLFAILNLFKFKLRLKVIS